MHSVVKCSRAEAVRVHAQEAGISEREHTCKHKADNIKREHDGISKQERDSQGCLGRQHVAEYSGK